MTRPVDPSVPAPQVAGQHQAVPKVSKVSAGSLPAANAFSKPRPPRVLDTASRRLTTMRTRHRAPVRTRSRPRPTRTGAGCVHVEQLNGGPSRRHELMRRPGPGKPRRSNTTAISSLNGTPRFSHWRRKYRSCAERHHARLRSPSPSSHANRSSTWLNGLTSTSVVRMMHAGFFRPLRTIE
jgi:hypothetical protein